jgi:hypothetical protein
MRGHLKDSQEFYKELFTSIPMEHLVSIQQKIIDCTKGDHWNDLSHNVQNVIIEYIAQNPDDALSILLSRFNHIKNYTALHKMADIYHQIERGIFKPGVTKMNGHIITEEMAEKVKRVFELRDQKKYKEAAKLVKKYRNEKWLATKGKFLNKNAINPKTGQVKDALKATWKPATAVKNMHKAGKAGAAFQVIITTTKHGYRFMRGEDLNLVDTGYDLIKESSGAYISTAVASQAAVTVGILLVTLTPAGWVVIPGTIAASAGAGIAAKIGCDYVWEKAEGTSAFRRSKGWLVSRIPTIKGRNRRKLDRAREITKRYPYINKAQHQCEKFIKLKAACKKRFGHPWHACPA